MSPSITLTWAWRQEDYKFKVIFYVYSRFDVSLVYMILFLQKQTERNEVKDWGYSSGLCKFLDSIPALQTKKKESCSWSVHCESLEVLEYTPRHRVTDKASIKKYNYGQAVVVHLGGRGR